MSNLVCPHCQSVVDQNAWVCSGCGAEIVRGASRKEKTTVGCLSSCIGIVVTLAVIGFILQSGGASNERGFVVLLGGLISALIFNVVGRLIVNLLFRSRVRFFRAYRHR